MGFGVSIVLLLLSLALVRQPSVPPANGSSHSRTAVKSAGVLQLTWLLGNEPHIASVEKPELHALRAAGMFDVQLSEMSRPMFNGSGKDEQEALLTAVSESDSVLQIGRDTV